MNCPHCGEPWGGHRCADKEPWTQAEKDEARAIARRLDPRIHFTPTFYSETHFSERNRLDRERA